MNAESSATGAKDFTIPCELLPADEFDLSGGEPSSQAPSPGQRSAETMLDATEIDFSQAALAGPAMALRLTVEIARGAELTACQQEFVGLLLALDGLDRVLGGRGLVVDPSFCEATDGTLTVVLRPLDVRWCVDRLTQMGEILASQPVLRVAERSPTTRNGEWIAEVISRCNGGGQTDTGSAREQVRNWRGRQGWMTGLEVELVGRNVG